MRNPERISRIIAKLEQAWQKHPDIRLGQLMSNLIDSRQADMFYVEDDVIEKWIEQEICAEVIHALPLKEFSQFP
jgi:uncharacterized protein YihD (DUF1040 family)